MPKSKSYSEELVIVAIDLYFRNVCFGDVKMLKMTQICRYLRANGFPKIKANNLNRDKVIRLFISNLEKSVDDLDYKKVISYVPLNVDDFIKTNNSIDKLKAALTMLDNYYCNLCNSIIAKHEETQNVKSKIAKQTIEIKALREELKESKEEIIRYKKITKRLELENKKYKQSIKDTLLPEIANEILRQEDVIYDGDSLISQIGYETMVIDDTSSLGVDLNYIKKQENKFNNSLVSGLFDSINED